MRQRQTRLQTNCPAMLHLADKNIVQDAGNFNGIVAPCRKRDHKICKRLTIKHAKRLIIKRIKHLIIKHIKYLTIQIVLVKIATVFLFQQLFHEPVGL